MITKDQYYYCLFNGNLYWVVSIAEDGIFTYGFKKKWSKYYEYRIEESTKSLQNLIRKKVMVLKTPASEILYEGGENYVQIQRW